MILSASRRTDIPAHFSEWLLNRLREGWLLVRNPMNPRQVSRVSLSPEVIDCIVFWTKNPLPMLPRLSAFRDYPFYFQFTLTGYGRDIEANLPDKRVALIPAFQRLSDAVGPERVIWRYDPILLNGRYNEACHLRAFADIARALRGRTEKCVVSFVDAYRWNRAALSSLGCASLSDESLRALAGRLRDIATENGMAIATCAEAVDLSDIGIPHNACVDRALIERITGYRVIAPKDPGQRPECLCAASVDVGAYNTCPNGCAYCYAARREREVIRRMFSRYDPASPMLCDALSPLDKVTDRAMKSLLDRQVSMTDVM